MKISKKNEGEFEVIKVIPERVEIMKYQRKFIEQQMLEIEKQRDEEYAQREIELQECRNILAEMDKQNK